MELQRLEELRTAAVPPPPNLDTEDPPPTRPADLAAEVNQLRAAVQALTQERDSLRANRPEAAEGQPTQTMPTQTMLAVGPLREQERVGCDDGHSDRGRRHRFAEESGAIRTILTSHCLRDARYGFRGVRVGEATHPGPPRRLRRARDLLSIPSPSDDAPLVQGRSVVPRIVEPSSLVASASS